jgi:hypothetical protein
METTARYPLQPERIMARIFALQQAKVYSRT